MRNKFVVPGLAIFFALALFLSAWAAPAQAQAGGPSARVGASLVNVDGRIFLFGGSSTSIMGFAPGAKLAAPALRPLYAEMGDLWEFNNENGNFTQIDISGESPAPRYGHAAAAADGKMYIFGGKGAEDRLNDAWVFDPDTHTWKELQPRGKKLEIATGAAAIADGGAIYVLAKNGIFIYEISDNFWAQVEKPPAERSGASIAPIIGGNIFFFGGWDYGLQKKGEETFIFDTATSSWKSIPCTGESLALEYATVVSQGNTIWVIGGLGEGLRGDILQVKIDETLSRCTVEKVASNILDYGRTNASAVLLPGSTESYTRILLFGGDMGGEIVGNPIVIELGEPAPSPTPTETPTQPPAPQSSPIPSETPRSPVGEKPLPPAERKDPFAEMMKFACNPCGSAPALLLLVMMLLAKRR
ncbi:MAG: Kelch repeat-containing protein [Chloroflexota bacterium]